MPLRKLAQAFLRFRSEIHESSRPMFERRAEKQEPKVMGTAREDDIIGQRPRFWL